MGLRHRPAAHGVWWTEGWAQAAHTVGWGDAVERSQSQSQSQSEEETKPLTFSARSQLLLMKSVCRIGGNDRAVTAWAGRTVVLTPTRNRLATQKHPETPRREIACRL
jgi:hypothetical protein